MLEFVIFSIMATGLLIGSAKYASVPIYPDYAFYGTGIPPIPWHRYEDPEDLERFKLKASNNRKKEKNNFTNPRNGKNQNINKTRKSNVENEKKSLRKLFLKIQSYSRKSMNLVSQSIHFCMLKLGIY